MVLFFYRIACGVSRFVNFTLVSSFFRFAIAAVGSVSRLVLDVLVLLRHAVAIRRLSGFLFGLFLARSRITLGDLHPAIAR